MTNVVTLQCGVAAATVHSGPGGNKPGPLTNAHRAEVSSVAPLLARKRARAIQ
jgi:hypothetical protein